MATNGTEDPDRQVEPSRHPVFLTWQEVANDLRVSVTTVDRLIKAGKLRSARAGNRVFTSPQALEAFHREAEIAQWGVAS